MARKQLRTTIFIACEGKNTERIYFEAIKEEMDSDDYFAVTVYPDSTDNVHRSHGLGLVEEARSRIEEFDEVWAVFDKDGYTKHAEAFELAATPVNEKIVNIAFSSIAFEQWILLHFLRSQIAYPKAENIITDLHTNHFYDGYEKTSYQNTYKKIRERTSIAIENSAWLKFRLATAGTLPGTPLHNINPYTDVDSLVKRLLKIDEQIRWGELNQGITIGSLSIVIIQLSPDRLMYTVTNNGPIAKVFNNDNIDEHCWLMGNNRNNSNFTLSQTTLIEPGATRTFELTAANPFTGLVCNVRIGNERLMIHL